MSEQIVPRIDPKSRAVDGAVGCRVKNPRPDRFYILANPNDSETGVSYYLDLGFEIERADNKHGTSIEGGRGSSELQNAIVRHGQILLSCPKSEQDARLAAKEAYADRVDAATRKVGSTQVDEHMSIHVQTNVTR